VKYAQPVGKGCEKMLAKPDRIWYPLMARALGTAYQGGPLPQCLRGKNVSCKGRIIMDLIKTLTANYMKPELPQMNVGDTVRVTLRVKEGSRERNQVFEGTIIARKHGGINETITVRRISYGVGCEKVFPVHSPSIVSVETIRRGKVRRAKLYYLRDRVGKAAKVKGLIN
jgi:large subunit ribosomal protein L19